MMSLLGPWTIDARVKLETGICKVKKICRLIKMTLVSLLIRMWKVMTSSMVTVQIKGCHPGINAGFDWLVSTMTGGARCSL
jgi:hypothetical protein